MEHLAKLSVRPDNIRPFHIECSCSTAGDFDSEEEARGWIQNRHFANLTGVFETQLMSFVPDPDAVVEEAPLPDFVDQFHRDLANNPTPSAPDPVSPPDSGAEVKPETLGDA